MDELVASLVASVRDAETRDEATERAHAMVASLIRVNNATVTVEWNEGVRLETCQVLDLEGREVFNGVSWASLLRYSLVSVPSSKMLQVIEKHKNAAYGSCACGMDLHAKDGETQEAWRRHLSEELPRA